jgi:catechol 2,3-dioxygenase-like lactoylglutathione lyase family enzyme
VNDDQARSIKELRMIHDENNALTRREVIRGTGAITIASLVASASGIERVTPAAQNKSASKDSAPLGQRIRGFQHFEMTVQSMDRAFAFYTKILGGTEIMQDGDFHGEKIHNTLMLNDEIEAIEHKLSPMTIGVPDLRGGQQRLDVPFIQFDNIVLELLHYRESSQPAGSGPAWGGTCAQRRSPAYPRSLHLCFHLRDDIDFNKFVRDLEAESARRGMTNVRCNRIVAVTTEEGCRNAPLETMSNKITGAGRMDGL